jgi:hypothetical protein
VSSSRASAITTKTSPHILEGSRNGYTTPRDLTAQWHQGVIDGTHYNGLDGEKYAPENVVPFLHSAAIALGEAYGAIGSAHSINSGVRWYETAKESENV